MKVIPAIDIVNGKCVRLTRGSFKHKVVYNDNPVDQAIIFQSMGFKKIHIVDLDGALDDNSINYKTIVEIRKNISIEIQLGEGIRSLKQTNGWFDLGIEKLIVGSMAQKNPNNLKEIINSFPKKIYIAIDDKNNTAMVDGWLKESSNSLKKTLSLFEKSQIVGFVYTDVNNDGTLQGLNIKKITEFAKKTDHKIIVGGGLKDIEDVKKIISKKINNIEGVIMGKAYYNGNINLKDLEGIVSNA